MAETHASPGEPHVPGLITRQSKPDNLEFPFAELDGAITGNERFFVRSHFETPEIDASAWRLRIAGAVERPLAIDLDDLLEMSARTVTALIECAGNGRVFLEPPQIGVRWELGAVGTAQWTGVPLAALLARAGVKPEAVDVVLVGADRGEFKYPQPPSEGEIPFARALPLSKAQGEEVLLAYAMNGQPLPREHGYPVRAIVPGWYGVASVKWLERIVVLDHGFHGYFHVFQYSLWQRHDGLRDLTPVTELQVKAQIARPGPHEVVDAGHPYLIRGAAWTGEGEIVCVEVSTDAGATWSEARLLTPAIEYTWRLWEYSWQVPEQPGRHVLMARATDAAGNTQPLERDADRRDTMITHVLPIEVEAR